MTIIEALIKVRNDLRTWMANSLSCAAIETVTATSKTIDENTICNTLTFINKHGDTICEVDAFQTKPQKNLAPKLKIENNQWYTSYDNGSTWESIGNAEGFEIKELTEEEYNNTTTFDDNIIYVVI